MSDTSRRRALGLSAGLLSLLLVGLVASELYLRSTIHPPDDIESFPFAHPPLASMRVRITKPMVGLSPRETLFTTSALGLRADELDLAGDHERYRILALGDSVTECLLLNDQDAWPRRLQDALQTASKRPVWVGNAARSGEMLTDYIAHIRRLAARIGADMVLIMPGGYELQAAVEEKLIPMDLQDEEKLAAYSANLYVEPNLQGLSASYLGEMLARRGQVQDLDMTDFYLRMRQRRAKAPKLQELPDLDEALDIYEAGLEGLVASWKAMAERPALVLITRPFLWHEQLSGEALQSLWGGYTCMDCPDPQYFDHVPLSRGLRAFNETLLRVCQREGLQCLDLERTMEKNLDNFYDDAHMKEAGAAFAARELAKFITERKLLK